MFCLFVEVIYFLPGVFFFLIGTCFVHCKIFHPSFSIFNMSDVASMNLPIIKILHMLLLSPMPVFFHQGTTALKLPRC